MKHKKVLILTANYGDGHLKIASSIEKELKIKDPSLEINVVNLFHEAHPFANKVIRDIYLKCYSNAPKFYHFLYYATKDIRRNYYINNIIGLFGRRKLAEYLRIFNPDIVINTFPVLAMPMMYKKGRTRIPCYTVITDYGVHSQWIDPGVTKYFVASEMLIKQMTEQGIEKDKIQVTGIPVSLECEQLDKEAFIKKYELKDNGMPIITLLAGASGLMRNLDETCIALESMKSEAQFLIVCGRNKALKELIQNKILKGKDGVKVFGFVDNLHEIMMGSDIVISKAGGITTTEALNMGVPLVVYGTPAGQEYENTKFLIKHECGYYAKNNNELVDIVSKLIKDPEIMNRMRENTKRISKNSGCSDIAEFIISELCGEKECETNQSSKIYKVYNFN